MTAQERRDVLIVMALSAFIGVGWLLTSVGSYSLFIEQLGAGALPLLYFAGALLSLVIGVVDGTVLQRYALTRRLFLVGVVTGTIAIGLGVLALVSPSEATAFALPLSFELAFVYGGLIISATALHRFDVRQSKRLYGISSSGRWFAIAIFGPLLAAFGATIDPAALVVAGGLSLAIGGILASKAVASGEASAREVSPERLAGQSMRSLRANPLARSIVALTVSGIAVLFLVEFVLLDRAEAQLEPSELTSLLAVLGGIQGVVVLVFLAISGPLLNRFGVKAGLLAMPVVLGIGTLALLAATFGDAGQSTLILAGALYVLEPAIRYGMTIPSKLLLYQPLPPEISFRVHGVVEGPLLAISTSIVAGVIALFVILDAGVAAIVVLLLLALLAWVPLAQRAIGFYLSDLSAAVNRRQLGEGLTLGAEARHVLVAQLADPDPGRVLAAARMLDDIDSAALDQWSSTLFANENPEVRTVALRWAEEGRITPSTDSLQQVMLSDGPWVDRFRAGTVAYKLGEPWVTETARQLMAAGDIGGVALLRSISPVSHDAERADAERALTSALESENSLIRSDATQALSHIAGPADASRLRLLMDDADSTIRQQSVRATARLSSPELWHEAIARVGDSDLYRALGDLIASDPGAREVLASRLAAHDLDRRDHLRLIRIAIRRGDHPLQTRVLDLANHADPQVRMTVLVELDRIGFVPGEEDLGTIRATLERLFARCNQLHGECVVSTGSRLGALDEALRAERTALARGLALVGYRPEGTSLAEALGATSDRRLSRALELLDQRLRPDDRKYLRAIEGRSAPRKSGAAEPLDLASYRWVRMLGDPSIEEAEGDVSISMVERVVALRSTAIFADTSSAVLLDVAESMEEHRLGDGDVLFSAGDPGERLFVVLEGAVDVIVAETVLDQLGRGEAFGELSLLEDKARSATVQANGDTLLLSLDSRAFQDLLIDQPEVSMAMLRYVARRLRDRTADPAADR